MDNYHIFAPEHLKTQKDMSSKKQVAKLVYMSMVTRVVVDEDATEEQIIEASRSQFTDKLRSDLYENIEEIVDDVEMPYNEEHGI
mgnify:CR=1 FL=1